MANYKTQDVLLEAMETHLRSLKPGINLTSDSDAHIRLAVQAGLGEGLYADLRANYLDIWPSSAREAALLRHKDDNQLPDVVGARWSGTCTSVGIDGALVSVNDVLIAESGERSYVVIAGGVIAGGVLETSIQAEQAGTTYNLADGEPLTFESPPPNVQDTALVSGTVTEGTDEETIPELRTRIIDHEVQEPAGGNATDYEREALAASPDVLTSSIDRVGPRGAGTLDLYITAGTTEIDQAIDAGTPVVRAPSAGLITIVQTHITSLMITTDDVLVYAYSEVAVPITVLVEPMPGFVITGGGDDDITPIIETIIEKYLYKLLPVDGIGVLVRMSELEALLDSQIGIRISDRKVLDFSPTQTNIQLLTGELALPGVITIGAFT